MLEMKISITAADLAAAINNLAAALDGRKNAPADKPAAPAAQPAAQPATPTANPTYAPAATPANGTAQVAPSVNNTPAPAPIHTPPVGQMAPAGYPTPAAPDVPLSVTPAQTVAPVAANPVPTEAPTYTLEMIATAGTALVDAGKMDMLCALLTKYGIDSITKLDPSQYGFFATELRSLGAQI